MRSNRTFPKYRDWAYKFLIAEPIPALIQLLVILFCRKMEHFPSIALAATFATFGVIQIIVFRVTREGFQYFPPRLHRYVSIVMNANLAADFASLVAIWLHTPADNPRWLLVVFPFWTMLVSMITTCMIDSVLPMQPRGLMPSGMQACGLAFGPRREDSTLPRRLVSAST